MSKKVTSEIVRKENRYGVEKDFIRMSLGTNIITVPRKIKNPITDRREDLKKLSDDGYLKPFLAIYYKTNSPNIVNLEKSPVLTFDKEKWEIKETEDNFVISKKESESNFGEKILEK